MTTKGIRNGRRYEPCRGDGKTRSEPAVKSYYGRGIIKLPLRQRLSTYWVVTRFRVANYFERVDEKFKIQYNIFVLRLPVKIVFVKAFFVNRFSWQVQNDNFCILLVFGILYCTSTDIRRNAHSNRNKIR